MDTACDRLKGVGVVSIKVCAKAAVVTAAVAVQQGVMMVCILMSSKTHDVHTEHTSCIRRSHVNEQILNIRPKCHQNTGESFMIKTPQGHTSV